MLTELLSGLLILACAQGGPVSRRQDFCPLFCPEDLWMPICGSDGRTYGNPCEFNIAHCKNSNLTKAFEGPCPALVRSRGIICTTPWCWPTDDPVCGSDGLTYLNVCELNNAMCDKENLKVEYRGPCHPQPHD